MPEKSKSPKSGAVELSEAELSAEELDQVTGGTSKDPVKLTIKFDPERLRSDSTNVLKRK